MGLGAAWHAWALGRQVTQEVAVRGHRRWWGAGWREEDQEAVLEAH